MFFLTLKTMFSFALIRTFDTVTPDVVTKEEFVAQYAQYKAFAKPYVDEIQPMVEGSLLPRKRHLRAIDALVSLAVDISIEALLESGIRELLVNTHSNNAYRDFFMSIPEYSGTMRPDIEQQLEYYRIPLASRRWYELQLFCGYPMFMIGRNLAPDGTIKFSPYPLHPLLRWLYYR